MVNRKVIVLVTCYHINTKRNRSVYNNTSSTETKKQKHCMAKFHNSHKVLTEAKIIER